MINPEKDNQDQAARQQAWEERRELTSTIYKAAGQHFPAALMASNPSHVVNMPLMEERITYTVKYKTKSESGQSMQDAIGSPFNLMTGPWPERRAREDIKAMDKRVNGFGQTDADVGEEQAQRRAHYVQSLQQEVYSLLGGAQHEQTVAKLHDLIQYVLLQWETRDPYITTFFEEIAAKISAPTSERLLGRLVTRSKEGDAALKKIDSKARTVLCELWWHIGDASKAGLRHAFQPWLAADRLKTLGNPLHMAMDERDAGTLSVLVDLGIPLDTVWFEPAANDNFLGMTVFGVIVHHLNNNSLKPVIAPFVHYMDFALKAVEAKQEQLPRQARTFEGVSQRVQSSGESAGARGSAYDFTAPSSSNAQGGLKTPRHGMKDNGWFQSSEVQFREETYGPYHALRVQILTAMNAGFLPWKFGPNLLNAGEFKAFMYLKWLCRIKVAEKGRTIEEVYLKPCHKTGNTYLHYLVSHWDDPDYVTSDYERHMRLSAIGHVLYIAGDKARLAKNKAGQTPWDLCDSDELKSILRYLNLDLSGTYYEWIMARLTWEPPSLARLPMHLTTDACQFVERVCATTQAYAAANKDNLTPLETELIESLLTFMPQYHKDEIENISEKPEIGKLICELQSHVTVKKTRSPYTILERWKSIRGKHYLNQLDELLDDVLLRHNVDSIGKQGLLDIKKCNDAHEWKKAQRDELVKKKNTASNPGSSSSLDSAQQVPGKPIRYSQGANNDGGQLLDPTAAAAQRKVF